ncbi:hypothetical protein [Streptomyces marispadix]|uniref:Uncharacterized protein n=1 Tax=Streptomyces marispadix TaxID=2922868 RepID=A0ABS9ST78_9ACTN|nr:hypothetical protein [Streptomyces marispadix]MCH6159457.1 hypothetical protein [Streptomyces marispadix]
MTSQARSAGSVICIVLATVSLLAALITAIVAINATSHVSDKLEPGLAQGYYDRADEGTGGYEPFQPSEVGDESTCHDGSADDQPDQGFWSCVQKDSAAWSAQVAARQADAQAKGQLAIVLGLFGLTFAIGAVASNAGARSAAQTAAPPAGDGLRAEARPAANTQDMG